MIFMKRGETTVSSRRLWFRTLLILFPFAVLAAMEAAVRLTGWGLPAGKVVPGWTPAGLPMFECREKHEGTSLCSTADYYLGYANPESFALPKDPSTVRIFCIGGSATAGMPFFKAGAFSRMLDISLNASPSPHRFEVINAGVKGYSSFEVNLLVEELMRYQPDWLVVYMGNNEYYGEFSELGGGRGSHVLLGLNRLIHKSRLYKLFQRIISPALSPRPHGDDKAEYLDRKSAWIKQRLENASVDAARRREAVQWYKDNLDAVIETAQQGNVKVVLCTLAVNKRDYPPITAGFRLESPEGCRAIDPGACQDVLDKARRVSDAGLSYRAGCCALQQGRRQKARTFFQHAVDTEPMPFRASSAINRAVRDAAGDPGIILADVEQAFNKASKQGIPGDDLFVDHVHPTIRGNRIIARTIMEAVTDELNGVLSPERTRVRKKIDRYCHMMPEEYMFRSYYTAARFCLAVGRPARALRHVKTALTYDPQNRRGLELRGYLEKMMRKKR